MILEAAKVGCGVLVSITIEPQASLHVYRTCAAAVNESPYNKTVDTPENSTMRIPKKLGMNFLIGVGWMVGGGGLSTIHRTGFTTASWQPEWDA